MVVLPNQLDGHEVDIVELLEHQAARRPDHPFVWTPSNVRSYAEVRARSARLAGALADLGVAKGTTVAVSWRTAPSRSWCGSRWRVSARCTPR